MKNMAKIKAILFDLDNTLVDFMRMKRIACSEAAAAMIGAGLKMEFSKLEKELFEFYMDYGIEGDFPFTEFLKKHNSYSDEILSTAMNAYHRVKNAFLEPYPGVIPTFVKLIKKGIKLGIVTNAPSLKAHRRIDAMKLQGFFDVVIAEANKPDTKGFLEATQKLNLKPNEVMMVGDWQELDIVGAKNSGLISCFASYGHTGEIKFDAKPDYTIQKIEEVLKIVG